MVCEVKLFFLLPQNIPVFDKNIKVIKLVIYKTLITDIWL